MKGKRKMDEISEANVERLLALGKTGTDDEAGPRKHRPPTGNGDGEEEYGMARTLEDQGLDGIRDFLFQNGATGLRWNEGKDGIEMRFKSPRKRWGVKKAGEFVLMEKKALESMFQEIKTYSLVGKEETAFSMGHDKFFDTVMMHARGTKMHNDWQEFWQGVKESKIVQKTRNDDFLFKAFLECFDLPLDGNGKRREKLSKYEKDALRMAFSTMVRRQQAFMDGRDEGVHARVSLCLRGPKKCGKSSFFGHVFPDANRARLFNPNLRLNVPWEKNYRNASGRGICHVADVHRYNRHVVEGWYSDADLETDSVLFLYEQGGKDVARSWALVYSANRDKKLANFDQFFDRLAIVDVEQKTRKTKDGKRVKVPRACVEFFNIPGNREKFWAAVFRCAESYDPSFDWKDKYGMEQTKRGKATIACPNDAICEKLFQMLDKEQHYELGAISEFLERNFDKIDWAKNNWLKAACMEYCDWEKPENPVWYKSLGGIRRVWRHKDAKERPFRPVSEL